MQYTWGAPQGSQNLHHKVLARCGILALQNRRYCFKEPASSSPAALTLNREHQESKSSRPRQPHHHFTPTETTTAVIPDRQRHYSTTQDSPAGSQSLLLLHLFSTRLRINKEPVVCEHSKYRASSSRSRGPIDSIRPLNPLRVPTKPIPTTFSDYIQEYQTRLSLQHLEVLPSYQAIALEDTIAQSYNQKL
ncbi:hypothetical protein K457DRAFT_25654 [Linnemannia elongata AG-77]|uniref:Uncharacterized protein n=1 Tax=Linnemannia elongata AG-77 TaxID=1314771 RepID=A0A197JCM4_9FUNG|nr:hypothetical protein K457DRAFT_25654 [Linnemannia elongata AG-77]